MTDRPVTDRTVDDIVDDLERSARRMRPFLIIGLSLIFLSLAASAFYLNHLRMTAEDEAAKAQNELRRFKALQQVVAVAQSATPEASKEILRQGSRLATESAASTPPPQVPLAQVDVNIFICSGSQPVNRAQAEALRRLRPLDASGRWQRNYLSETVNGRANYRLARNEIRYNPNEAEAAGRLQTMVRDRIGAEAVLVLTFFPTPNAVSVFFCNGATPPHAVADPG